MRPSVSGWPSTRATLLMPKDSSIGVSLYSCSRTASGTKPFLISMTRRRPCSRSVRSLTSAMPWSFFEPTRSLILAITFSGPTVKGSWVTTRPLRRAVTVSTATVARILNVPRPVSYASRMPGRPTMRPPVGRSGPGTCFIRASRSAFGYLIRWRAAAMTSRRLCGGMFVAIPTAMPEAPLTRRFGKAAGRATGSCSWPS